MVRLRLKRFGRRHRPFYRLCVMDMRSARDSKVIEQFGHFDPLQTDAAKALKVDADRAKYWLGVGAQPSQTVRDLLCKANVMEKPARRAKPGQKQAAEG